MSEYQAPLKEMRFAVNQLANLSQINQLPVFEDATEDLVEAVLEQAGVLASEVFSPLNQPGDEHSTFIENNVVVSPPGFAQAYQQFVDNGWQGIGQPIEFGGQGLPYLLHSAVAEMWGSANLSLALCPLLTSGAIEAINTHANDELKQRYLQKMVSGEWSGTMNLTEPQAGTDLAAIRTRAERDGDYYRITGQKIFITWGAHEMSKNIVHLVLARLPDAPDGVKGISLFLVPRYLPDAEGNPGEQNDLKVVSLESKLGIHASPTCVMSYGDNEGAIGYLVGEENNGLACMFTMMNNARLEVGMQGVSLSERAYQRALTYAQQRVQGNAHGHQGRVSIIHHPDVRRMLMQMRAITEAGRALAYVTAAETDLAHHAASAEARAGHQSRVDLFVPIVKSWCTEMAQEATTLGVQVHGGMGFIEETGAAQYMRDARIVTIYEGTTGIQALDLMGRKIQRDRGKAIGSLIDELRAFEDELNQHGGSLGCIAQPFGEALNALQETTNWYLSQAVEDPYLTGAIGVNYQMLVGNVVCGWLMARSAVVARAAIDSGSSDNFYTNKIKTAVYYAEQILPRCAGLQGIIKSGSDSIMSIEVDEF
ncbi:MAG: acyl-CoA dehydrogenase [Gammaproteobacteria bacterium]|nr:acyl-CoA dehydrogenase [Gammaproteobacteria bacterium]